MIPRTETPKSSNVAAFSHEGGVLRVEFKSGHVYEHSDVSDELAARMLANHSEGGSVGSFYHHYIKTNPDIPPAKKIS
jgi:hypothetical protein